MENLTQEIEKFYDNYQGAEDLRSPEEKAKDWMQTEFVTEAAPVNWVEKKPEDWRSFPILNQFFTSKCVAFTTAKIALINFWLKTKEFLKFSPNSIYDYRSNKPAGGMINDEPFLIWETRGISLESVAKSDQIQETDPIELSLFSKEVAKGFKLGNHITIPEVDFDRVASTIQTTGKGIMCWFYFTSREWSKLYPQVIDNLFNPYVSGASRHSVTAVDFGLIDGKQYLKIEDSAHFGGLSVRYVSREFFNARNFLIKYPMNFNYEEPQPVTPVFKFLIDMKLGDKNNDVKELQTLLRKLGFFPSNVEISGYYGNISKDSVRKFQLAHNLNADGTCGPLTRQSLNSL